MGDPPAFGLQSCYVPTMLAVGRGLSGFGARQCPSVYTPLPVDSIGQPAAGCHWLASAFSDPLCGIAPPKTSARDLPAALSVQIPLGSDRHSGSRPQEHPRRARASPCHPRSHFSPVPPAAASCLCVTRRPLRTRPDCQSPRFPLVRLRTLFYLRSVSAPLSALFPTPVSRQFSCLSKEERSALFCWDE